MSRSKQTMNLKYFKYKRMEKVHELFNVNAHLPRQSHMPHQMMNILQFNPNWFIVAGADHAICVH